MKKNTRSIIGILIVLAMLMCIVPTAFAVEESEWNSLTQHYDTDVVFSTGACEGALDTANFCLRNEYIAKGDYSISVEMQGTMGMPNTKHVQEGIIPWYLDNNNFLYAYVEWSGTERPDDIRQMHVSGKVNGEHIGWNDIWCDGIHVAQNEKLTLKVEKITEGDDVKIKVALYQGETEVKAAEVTLAGKAEAMNQDGAKMGVYGFGDIVAFSGFTSNAPKAEVESGWTSLTQHYITDGVLSTGACEGALDTANFCLRNEYIAKGDYSISVKMRGTMGMPNTKHVQEGIIPWYVDNNNFLYVYVEWSNTDRPSDIRQMHISGKVNGEHIGWNDIWCDGIQVAQNNELTLKVDKITEGNDVKIKVALYQGETEVKAAEVTLAGKAEAMNQDGGKMGVYAFGDAVAFYGFESTADVDNCANGHSFTNYVSNNDATCTQNGTETAKCDRCEETDTREVPGSAGHKDANSDYICDVCESSLCVEHTPEVIPAVPATCEDTGLTEGKKCAKCGEILEVQNVTDALGHSFTNYVSNNDVTCTQDGTETAKCDRCEETDTREIPGSAKGHTLVNGKCECGYETTYWTSLTEHYTINGSTVTSTGACEAILNTTNFALHSFYSAEGDLTLSVDMQGTMGLPNTKHVQEGIIPWYVDENNYLFVYVQWSDNDRTGDVHQIHVSGKINGEHLGWGDIWCDGIVAAQNEKLTLTVQKITEGQNVKLVVTLSRGNEILKTGERVLEGKAEALSKPGKVGVYAFNDTVTFSNFTSTGPDNRPVPDTGDNMPIFAVILCMSAAAMAVLVINKKRCF